MTSSMTRLLSVSILVATLGAAPAWAAGASTDIKTAPTGVYQIDPAHTSVSFKINHLGFSHFTGRFDKAEGVLNMNSATPEKSTLDVTVYPNSVNTNSAKLDEELRGDKYFDVVKNARASFHATKIERTSATTGKITGELTLLGVTKPLVLDASFVGTGEHPFTHKQVVGFSATSTLHRSEFGLTALVPMVGDDVTLQIETEFNKAD